MLGCWPGALLAEAHPAAAYDCSEQGVLDELNAYQNAQPKASGMCQSAQLQIKVMKKQIEIINRCPGDRPQRRQPLAGPGIDQGVAEHPGHDVQ
jgi:hypothetical protein